MTKYFCVVHDISTDCAQQVIALLILLIPDYSTVFFNLIKFDLDQDTDCLVLYILYNILLSGPSQTLP
jgi:hypothetical protein